MEKRHDAVPYDKIIAENRAHPNKTREELAFQFGCSVTSIRRAFSLYGRVPRTKTARRVNDDKLDARAQHILENPGKTVLEYSIDFGLTNQGAKSWFKRHKKHLESVEAFWFDTAHDRRVDRLSKIEFIDPPLLSEIVELLDCTYNSAKKAMVAAGQRWRGEKYTRKICMEIIDSNGYSSLSEWARGHPYSYYWAVRNGYQSDIGGVFGWVPYERTK